MKNDIVPEGWKIKKLGEVCEIKSGKNQSKVINPNGKYPIYGSSGIFGYADEYICDENTTIIGRKGTINSPLYVTTKFWNVDTAFGLCAKDIILSKFLYYFCLGFNFKKLDKSTTIPSLAKTDLLAIDIIIPPIETQQGIVSKIEELFSELDKGITELRLAQEQLKVYRQSVLKYAFEGQLTNDNVKDGELPAGWKVVSFNDVCIKVGDIDHKMPRKVDNGIYPYLSTKDFTDDHKMSFDNVKYISEEDFKLLSRKIKPEKGDIIFPRYGTIGKNILVDYEKDFLVSYSCAIIKPNEEIVDTKYLYHYSLSPAIGKEIRKYVVETTQANIGIASIKKFIIPLPPISQQKNIVLEIESRLSVADNMEESIVKSLQKAEALRQSILKKAFNGELVTEVKTVEISKIKNEYFKQLQLVALVINGFKKEKIDHGEMTLAKNLYLLDSIYKIPTGFKYDRWHLGPYPPALKKVVNNKEYFKRNENFIETTNEEKLQKYSNPLHDDVNTAIADLSSIFSKYNGAERSHKTELLATVCKVIEDIKSTDLAAVRQSMKEWKIDLKTSKFKNKADKFNKFETEKCIGFIVDRGWDRKLIENQ